MTHTKTLSPNKPASGLRGVLARASKLLGKFTGTPLPEAERIMGESRFHPIGGVEKFLCHPLGFADAHPHLNLVPYKREELEWAVQHGFVLTLYTSTVRRLNNINVLSMDQTVWCSGSGIFDRRPDRPQWRLVLRAEEKGKEDEFLRNPPAVIAGMEAVASAALAASAAYLDLMLCDHPYVGLHSTKTSVPNGKGGLVQVVVGENPSKAGPPLTLGAHSPEFKLPPPTLFLKPHNIPRQ